ncbi:hypothetical protein [Methylobacillus sp. Pita1]|uniref:hypothetical protein n=1 Tax=Methylobacillus sp. Pita1 TaxID=3382642 RepID=UPI0038B436CD
MRLLQFFRSPTFALFSISAWVISFLVIAGSQAHNNVGYLILFIPVLLSLQLKEINKLLEHPLAKMLVVVIFSLILSACIGDGSPWKQAKFGAVVLLFYLAVARLPLLLDETVYKAAWALLGLLITYVIFNAILQYAQGSWTLGSRLGELYAKLENVIYVTNTMGGMMAIITFLGMRAKRYREVLIAHILVLFFSLTILQTRSIIGIWALITLLASLSLYRQGLFNRKLMVSLISVGLVFIMMIIGLIFFSSIGDSLLTRKFYRFEIWDGFIAETLRCGVWLGCGPEHKFTFITQDQVDILHSHSAFVTQFYKAGIVGFIPLVTLTVWAIIRGLQEKSWAAWYFMVGALGLCFDGSSLFHSTSQRWLVFHLPLALLIAQELHSPSKLAKTAT